MSQEKRQTDFQTCNHCGNHAPMEIVAEYYRSTTSICDDDDPYEIHYPDPEEGFRYNLLLCLSCKEVTLKEYFEAIYSDEYITIKTLYPMTKSRLAGLPSKIQQAYEIAFKVRVIDVNAYAVIIGRILEMICEDQNAIGKDLYSRLDDLSTKGKIPTKLVGVAHSLRKLRNFGAHASLGELTRDEIPILDDLCRAILEYVYNAPFLVEQAERQLNIIKDKRSKESEQNETNLDNCNK
jgi:Domain of unknown function (DUF4145)